MALSGIQIYKLVPQTNCKECGFPTCLAFAMKLAAKKAELSLCPYASDEAKAVLGAAAEPPVKSIGLGPDGGLKLGEETVLYRHEKTFVNQTALAVEVRDTDPKDVTEATLVAVRDYTLERVGEVLVVDMICVSQKGDDKEAFSALVKQAAELTGKPLLISSPDADVLEEAAKTTAGQHNLLASATPDTADRLWPVAKEHGHALAVTAADLNELTELAGRIKDAGFNDLVLHFETHSPAEGFQTNSIARKAALRNNYKPLGYPFLSFIQTEDELEIVSDASNEILKYGGVVVLPKFDPALVSVLMTLRMIIFTDPQKPIQVEPKLYSVGEPNESSPVFVTTNFSLTYFIVSGEIENSTCLLCHSRQGAITSNSGARAL
jgi:acetyl-CoA decarbonylase/synthase complex subunit gamma